jgi:UDP-N-acetylmuramate--alanine ligase
LIRHSAQRIHLAGIGGAGMSGIAELLCHYGHAVTGSDRMRSATTIRLENLGVRIQYDHTPELVRDARLLIYSSAIREDNPERAWAAEHRIISLRRAEALGQLMLTHTTVCIAGTHGKTTTTSLVGEILTVAGRRPTVMVGGTLRAQGAPMVVGDGRIMVAEADEYDRSFLAMFPAIALITNIDADHLDCYTDLEDIKNTFTAFAARIPFYGATICCSDDSGVRSVLPSIKGRVLTYGTAGGEDYGAESIDFAAGMPSFNVRVRGKPAGRITLGIPGMHNVRNALGAVAVAMEMDVSFATIASGLEGFKGVRRRFEIVGCERGVTVVDDYAHHPGEISATLDAARRCGFKRIIAVFQPHLYSRTRDFLEGFAASLSSADLVIVTDIYQSREDPIPGVNAAAIVEKITAGGHRDARFCPKKEDAVRALLDLAASGDAVIVMGAGDINEAAFTFIKEYGNG